MQFDLTAVDYDGNTIVLDHSCWVTHVRKHPEIAPYWSFVPTVLGDPNSVYRQHDGAIAYYRLGLSGAHYDLFMVIIVREFQPNAQKKVVTCHTIDRPKNGGTLLILRRLGR